MSNGVTLYGGAGDYTPWAPPTETVPVNPSTGAGRFFEVPALKKQAVVSVAKTPDGFKVKVTVDGVLVSEAEVSGASTVLTVAI